MDPMKIGKQPFYILYMKFMMWLDYASSKFPIPWLQEVEKERGKFTAYPNYSQALNWYCGIRKLLVEHSRSLVKIQIFFLAFRSHRMGNFELA